MRFEKSLTKKRKRLLPWIKHPEAECYRFSLEGVCSEKEALYLSSILVESSKKVVPA